MTNGRGRQMQEVRRPADMALLHHRLEEDKEVEVGA
jgi:hypothetical protein